MEDGNRNDFNPWKAATFAIVGVIALALTAGLVVANFGDSTASDYAEEDVPAEAAPEAPAAKRPEVAVADPPPPPPRAQQRPRAADIEDCNAYARNVRNRTEEALKGAIVGGAVGAGVGAAGGAIAKGGKGAGKGAGIGSIVGATVGTLYGLDQANQANAQAEAAYRQCMARRGYTG